VNPTNCEIRIEERTMKSPSGPGLSLQVWGDKQDGHGHRMISGFTTLDPPLQGDLAAFKYNIRHLVTPEVAEQLDAELDRKLADKYQKGAGQ
jgi:hypothetical protein